jgi:hypothetical protein
MFQAMHTFRATLALTAAVTVIGVLTGTVFRADHEWILNHVGFDLDALKAGRVWTMPAAMLIQASAGVKWHQPLVLLLFVGLLEYQAGSLRALIAFFLSDWISSPLTILALWGLGALDWSTAGELAETPDMGSSAASFGAVAAGAVMLPRPYRETALAVLIVYLVVEYAFEPLDVAMAHSIAAALGGGLGLLWRRHRTRTVSLDLRRLIL